MANKRDWQLLPSTWADEPHVEAWIRYVWRPQPMGRWDFSFYEWDGGHEINGSHYQTREEAVQAATEFIAKWQAGRRDCFVSRLDIEIGCERAQRAAARFKASRR